MSYIENKKKITEVFKQLRLKKNGSFIAKQNWTCCNTCGWAEIPDADNCIFYNMQDTEMLKKYGYVYLSWCGDANKIIDTFENYNINVTWNGTDSNRIKIDFNN